MKITGKENRQWSRLGSRATYGQAILMLAEINNDIMVLSADLGNSSGLDRFKSAYPDKFINIGIAEQNMIGVAAGLAKEGSVVFASSFAPFISMRAAEQVRMNMGYMDLNIKAVAIGSGLSMAFLGNSHFGLEDAAIMRSIPNMTVVCPADCAEIVKTVFAAAEYPHPMYIRLTGAVGFPVVYEDDYDFEIGKAVQILSGSDVSIIATGSMVYESIVAAKILKENNIEASVLNMHTIKPIDESALNLVINKGKPIFTIEEHSITGGLGSAVAEYTSSIPNSPTVNRIGLPDEFVVTGEYRYLLEKYGLVGDQIASTILKSLNK
ncbi:MAG TPA: transketolase C-terminal domain-containing protein [Sediminibacterium sp.]|uniref:transketolase family protein n=1 Tax=Sediminibacterium sp. TaxID=1917865 RepID=UPI0008D3B252|nr:transketolase C-terminal domain-containing protein [Sediminibacterium sp.]OHC84538.1 MAG: transketolase [Sphingobacteriia bacterium RIFOXYC2_FULL_35_18]OHC89050.1 MAG: transketolase [Sphingobacteriia bacterium RIFOXYD2_FULL_35_12]HLD53082.1 transketolase C-terminal domain-containing protein [Sediminibacterium sp.]